MKTIINFLLVLILSIAIPAMTFSQEMIKSYEYWYDSNIGSRTAVTISPVVELNLSLSLPSNSLSSGFHVFNIRLKDDSTRYSSVISQHFYKAPLLLSDTNKITAYEYWVDNNIAGRIMQNITPQNNLQLITGIDMTAISSGFHIFNIRFKDEMKMWSSVQSQYFYKAPVISDTVNKIVAYEYWIDNNFTGRITQNVTSQNTMQLLTGLNLSSLTNGFHIFNIRFRDEKKMWSSAQSYHFFKSSVISDSVNKITAYEYWYDDNYVAKVYQGTTPQNTLLLTTGIDASALSNGFHVFNIRFKDEKGLWSSTHSSHFYNSGDLAGIPNSVDAYRYWFDGNLTTLTTVNLSVATNPLNLVANINALNLTTGTHILEMQYRDLSDNWSSAIHGTFYRTCIGGTATITPGGNILFCAGDSVTLTANSGLNYLWSTGDTTQSITVYSNAVDSVIVTNPLGCVDWSDPVSVIVSPLPTVTLNLSTIDTLCITDPDVMLIGGNPTGGYYSGSFVTNNNFSPSVAGVGNYLITYNYSDANSCYNSASSNIHVDICSEISSAVYDINCKIFPNPFHSDINIQFNAVDNNKVEIYSVVGELVYSTELTNKQSTIYLKQLSNGVYYVKINTGNNIDTIKLVKQ